MTDYPKELLNKNRFVRIINSDTYAVYVNSINNQQLVNVIQKSHCLEVVLSGKVSISSGRATKVITAGELQFRKRGNYQVLPGANYAAVHFYIENEFIIDFLKQGNNFPVLNPEFDPFQFIIPASLEIITIITNVQSRIVSAQEFTSCIIKQSLQQILFQIFEGLAPKEFVSYLKMISTDRKIELSYFMDINFKQKLSLNDMARLSGRGITTFKRDFKAIFNTSPFKWLINKRLEFADVLLRTTSQSVSEIAYEAGFENISHFSRCYRLKFNLSPAM